MAEVYDPSNPYGGWVEDPSNTGAQIWDPYYYMGGGYVPPDYSNPYDDTTNLLIPQISDPNVVGSTGWDPLQGTSPLPGFEELLQERPTYYPGTQYPNIAIGIPGIIGIGTGGLVTGGLLDLLGGSGGGYYPGPTSPTTPTETDPGVVAPLPGVYDTPTMPAGPTAPATPNETDPNTVYPLPGVYEDNGTGPNPAEEQPNNTIYPLPGVYDPNPNMGPNPAETNTGPATILPPPVTPENPQQTTIYAPLGTAFGVPTPVNPVMPPLNPPPTQPPTLDPATSTPPLNRNYYNEGAQGTYDLQRLLGGMLGLYGNAAGGYTQSDFERYSGLLGQLGLSNAQLTGMAADQTRYANRDLRAANLQDVNTYGQQALAMRQQANPELYSSLNRLDAAAGMNAAQGGNEFLNALLGGGGLKPSGIQTALEAQAQQGLALGRDLSAEDVRMSQQAAREAGAARGRLGDMSTMAAEVLNRDSLARQRENERRAFAQSVDQAGFAQRAAAQQGNIGLGQAASALDLARQQQGYNQLMGAAQMRSANAFDPFGTILGAQYGMQSSNVGTNQQLFNQGAGFSSGAFGNQYVQQAYNPFNTYAADVYGSNFNAANARQIASSNNAAASQAATNALLGQAIGGLFNWGTSTNWGRG